MAFKSQSIFSYPSHNAIYFQVIVQRPVNNFSLRAAKLSTYLPESFTWIRIQIFYIHGHFKNYAYEPHVY